ncbi:probable glutamate receptor, partial [Fopius arisanus]|uniref:Probable glutamate receptor n=1 Tax=Fopius arisanus TaxID=64838 RepID=A0A9R1UAU9_9HYME
MNLLLLILPGISILFVKLSDASYYGQLIKNVYVKYNMRAVLIVRSEQSMERSTVWHESAKQLFDEGIPISCWHTSQYDNRTMQLEENIQDILHVSELRTMEELQAFQLFTNNMEINNGVWLMIFMSYDNQDICEYCHEPSEDLFNSTFDLKRLVVCCNSKTVTEWKRSHTNGLKNLEVGQLVDDNRGVVWIDNSNYYDHFSMNELSIAMNFTISKMMWDHQFGTWDAETANWTGAIGKVHRNEADIGVSDFLMTNRRADAVSFASPIIYEKLKLNIKKNDAGYVMLKAYFKSLATDVWIVIIGLIVITPLLLTIIRYRRRDHFFPLLFENYSSIWGIYCQQSLPECPEQPSQRIIYLSILICSYVTLGAYSGSMISSLAVIQDSSFNTLEDLIEDGSYKLLVFDTSLIDHFFTVSDERLQKKMKSLIIPLNSTSGSNEEAFQRVCRERVAFFTTESTKKALFNVIPCELSSIGTGIVATASIILPLNSINLAPINDNLRKFRVNGLIRRLEQNYFRQLERKKTEHPPVTVRGIVPLLMILAVGLSVALIIFMIERNTPWFMQKTYNTSTRRVRLGKHTTFP